MGDGRRPLLRPARAQGSARPADRRGVVGAGLTRILCAAALCWWLGAGTASADTLGLAAYRARLVEARSLATAARSVVPASEAPPFLARARDLLRATDAVTLADGTRLPIDDSTLAARLDGVPAVDEALASIDARIVAVDRTLRPGALTAANADAQLNHILRARAISPPQPSLLELVASWVVDRIDDVVRSLARAGVSVDFLPYAIAGVGIGAALIVLAILGRGVGERIRREAVVVGRAGGAAADPAVHLRLADDALAAGRPRDALHELYLYAFGSLAAREAVHFDPALTDRELLARAAGIAQIGALRSLVALHERVWFGLKTARDDDVTRARDLARRIAA